MGCPPHLGWQRHQLRGPAGRPDATRAGRRLVALRTGPCHMALTDTQPTDTEPASGQDEVTTRPLMVTLGSLHEPHGGTPTRARMTAEVYSALGATPAIVSTHEPAGRGLPTWASSLR